jgi:hypothetical protein
MKKGTKINLKVENITVTVVSVQGNKVRYEGPNGERGILNADKIQAEQIVKEELRPRAHHTTAAVFFNGAAAGTNRKIFKCYDGRFCAKHNKELVEVAFGKGEIKNVWEVVQ